MDAYRKVVDEIQQVRDLADAKLAEGLARGEAIGVAKGRRAALLAVLSARGLSVSEQDRARIEGEDDATILDRWIGRATTASSVEEVLSS